MHIQTPFRAVGDVIDEAVVGDKFAGAAFTHVAAEFHFCDDAVRDGHGLNYKQKDLLLEQEVFLFSGLYFLYFVPDDQESGADHDRHRDGFLSLICYHIYF